MCLRSHFGFCGCTTLRRTSSSMSCSSGCVSGGRGELGVIRGISFWDGGGGNKVLVVVRRGVSMGDGRGERGWLRFGIFEGGGDGEGVKGSPMVYGDGPWRLRKVYLGGWTEGCICGGIFFPLKWCIVGWAFIVGAGDEGIIHGGFLGFLRRQREELFFGTARVKDEVLGSFWGDL